jgi:hypothetical protein
MKNNKITIIFDDDDAKKFSEISRMTKWKDRDLVSIILRHYYKSFSKDWKKAVIDAMEEQKSLKEES